MKRHCDFFEYFRVLFFSTEPFNVQTRLESLNAQQDGKLGLAHLFGAKISQIFEYHKYHSSNKAARKFDCLARWEGKNITKKKYALDFLTDLELFDHEVSHILVEEKTNLAPFRS